MLIRIGTPLPDVTDILKSIERTIITKSLKRDLQKLISRAKNKKPTIQLFRKIKAIIVKILCKIDYYIEDTHFIDQSILSQNTYHKTLTSRP